MSNFKQEDRYLILKRSDIAGALSEEKKIDLYALAAQVCEYRAQNGKPVLQGVVIEKGWEPLCSQVWNSIKRMSEGRPLLIDEMLSALEEAKNGLLWYQSEYPESAAEADHEAIKRIDLAISDAKGCAS